MKICLFFLFLLFGTSPSCLCAQEDSAAYYPLGKNHAVRVHLPADYATSKLSYPTIYVFDGQVLFDVLVAFYRYNQDEYPPAILVGIEQLDRGKEFLEKGETNPEGNSVFSMAIAEKLIPDIDRKYRTNSIRVGIGHSHGGTFVLNAALGQGIFNAVISISPTLWVNRKAFFQKYPASSSAWKNLKKFYCGYGENDFPAIQEDVDRLFTDLIPTPISKQKKVFRDEDHNSSILCGMRKGIEYIFQDFRLSEEEWETLEDSGNDSLFIRHFQQLSDFWNEKIIPGEDDFNQLGYFYSEREEIGKAEQTFQEALRYYPGSANLYDSLGELYEKKGDADNARTCYRKALEIAEKNKDYYLMIGTFTEHLQRLE